MKVDGLLKELKAITMKHKGGLLSFWGRQLLRKPFHLLRAVFQKSHQW